MASKTRKKSNNRKKQAVSVRPIDVSQNLSRQLHAAAFRSLAELLQTEPIDKHLKLVADVFQAGRSAIERFVFVPDDPDALQSTLDAIVGRLPTGSSVDPIRRNAESVRKLLAADSVDADTDPKLLNSLADRAVRVVSLRKRLSETITAEIELVEQALRQVQQGQDESALATLAPIGFRSVMSPWRLLVRGIVQFYQGNADEAAATWQRLPADRTPRGIARAMLATVSRSLGDDPPVDQRRIQGLVDQQPDTKAPQWRERLRDWFDRERYDDIAEELAGWQQQRNVDPDWLAAMRDRIYAEMLGCPNLRDVRRTVHHLPPPAWDPKCALPQAIAKMLSSDPTKGKVTAEVDAFLAALEQNQTLSPVDRKAIIAVLNLQIAYLGSSLLEQLGASALPVAEAEAEAEAERQDIGKRFGLDMTQRILRCIKLWPNWDTPYQLISFRIDPSFLDDDVLSEIHESRLSARGEEVAVLLAAAEHFVHLDRQDRSEPLLQNLLRIAPRDPVVRILVWNHEVLVFRRHAAAGEIAQAAATVDRMSAVLPPDLPPGLVSLLRTAIAFKAGDDEAAQTYVEDACANGITRFSVTFLMELHAIRLKLPAGVKKQFRDARKKLMKAPSLEEVAQTCRLCSIPLAGKADELTGGIALRKDLVTAAKRAISKARPGQWTLAIANDVGMFVVMCDDGVLRRKFISELHCHRDWHIVTLVRAIERGPEGADYLLRDVVKATDDHPMGMPPIVKPLARELYQRSRAMDDLRLFDDDDDDVEWDDDDEWDDGGSIAVPSVSKLIDTMPPEMLELFRDDPKAFENAMRATVPAEVVNLILPALHAMIKTR